MGFGALALLPGIAALVTFQVLRRSGDYAIARPTREVLYTVVPREDRYKAKSFIDTVVYRAGDQVGAWSFTLLSSGLGMGAKEIGLVGSVVAHYELMNAAHRLADRLLQGAPLAQRAIKEVAVRAQQLPMLESIRFGETMRKVAAATEDAAEGGRAAAEGRTPEWHGR